MKRNVKYIFPVLGILITFGTILFSGCASAPQQEFYETLSSERLINKLEANRRKVHSMEGTGTISVKTSKFENSASFKIMIQKPDSIYLNIYGPFNIDLAQILVTRNNFVFLESLNNTAYTGKLNENILKEIFKVDLPFSELIDAFTGAVNLSSRLYKEPSFFDIVQDKYLLTYVDSASGTLARYSVDVKDLSIISSKLEDLNGNIILEGSYGDQMIAEALSIPKSILVQNVKGGESVSIQYRNITLNKKGSYIDFKIPEDADIIKW